MPLGPGDAWLLGLPVYHVAGIAILCRCLLAGACVRLPGPAGPEPTHFSMVPTQLQDAVEATWDWSAVKGVLLGGAAISERLVRWAVEAGVPLHCSWGMTETASQVTATPVGAAVEALLTAGRCLPEREVRVVEGEIQVRGATMFSGYLGREARKPGDWFATGDVGELDTGGWLRVLGRKDSQFISGGENIHPEVIERAMAGLDGVARVMVVPVLDERFGQRPAALVEVDREEWTPEEWATALETLLPKYMVPVDFIRAPGDWKERMKWSRVDVQEWVTTS